MAFGNQTITFVSLVAGDTADDLGTYPMVPTSVDVKGCHHRPVSSSSERGAGMARAEQDTEIGVSTAVHWWKTTAPPHPAVLAAKASDVIEVDGLTYQIITGPQPFVDGAGRMFKVTILSERQDIG